MPTASLSSAYLDRAHPTARKLVVGPTLLWGREALRALARRTGGWTGWEAGTLRSLADELAFVSLSDADVRPASDIEIGALVGSALDQSVSDHAVAGSWHDLASHAGFRRAILDAVLELRAAGVGPDQIRQLDAAGPVHHLAAVVERFAALLKDSKLLDPAGVFTAALAAFETEAPFVLAPHIFLAPGLGTRGLPGRLLHRLLDHGAQLLDWATLKDQNPPTGTIESLTNASEIRSFTDQSTGGVDIFAAATPADEVREALRRALAEGCRLDEVELVATDPDAYGTALDALARHLGFSATLQEGLPHQRSRIGRAVSRHLDWIDQGLPADLLREALEAGDITPPDQPGAIDPAVLAHALRSLRIGWGRARYDVARQTLDSGGWAASQAKRHRDPEDAAASEESTTLAAVATQLSNLLGHLLDSLPPVPELGGGPETHCAPQEIAQALLSFLNLVPLLDASDRFNAERLRGRLQQLSEAEESQRPFGAALAEIREALANFRVWTQVSPTDPPRLSHGGAVHLSDLRHAGVTGRRRIFVLGLDADRVAGPRVADPLLPDAVRQELPGLGTTAARRAEARWLVGRAIAGLTGRVTLSFATQSDDGGEAGPAPVLLEVARELASNPRLDYKQFRQQLAAPACPVPGAPGHALDRRDVWLHAIGAGDVLLDGTAAVRIHNPGLAAGLRAVESLDAAAVTAYHGVVDAAAGRFDPTRKGAGPISASSLELLSKCPLSWFYSYVLEVRALDDPEYDPDLWLDPMARGSLLHAVFERFVKQYLGRQGELGSEAASAELSAICEALLVEQRAETPPPSETVFQSERAEILRAAKSFLAMERGLLGKAVSPVWQEAEFWISGKQAVVPLPNGSRFQLKGKIDRIDGLPNGAKLIVDYKTGGLYDFRKNSKAGPLNGGRKLQPALYSAAYATMSGTTVTRFEYRFPTAKGRNAIIAHHPDELALGREVVAGVITNLTHGAFLPTLDADDCKYCDHRDICRVRGGEERFEKIQSPRAVWASQFGAESEFYRAMIARRAK